MPEIITSTRPTPEGEMLWRVHLTGTWWDNDPRMVVFVLAKGRDEALKKAEPLLARARKDVENNLKVEAHIATIESFVATEERQPPGGRGIVLRAQNHWPITLADPDDAKRYRLAVCLVPVE
jgi:hypothetical protein